MKNKICKKCNKEYTPTSKNQRFCGSVNLGIGCSRQNELLTKRIRNLKNEFRGDWGRRKKLKLLLIKKESQCEICKCRENLSIDHKIPQCYKIDDSIENLRVLCKSCNTKEYHKLTQIAIKFYFDHLLQT